MKDFDFYKEYIKNKHGNQKRKQGTLYYLHPIAVAEILKEKNFSYEYQVAGLFHDLLEDTDTTYDELLSISNKEIAEVVKLVTKKENYDMKEYMERISKNEMARMVKLADRIHNLKESVYADQEWRKRYIEETKRWFDILSIGTVFEDDLNCLINQLDN